MFPGLQSLMQLTLNINITRMNVPHNRTNNHYGHVANHYSSPPNFVPGPGREDRVLSSSIPSSSEVLSTLSIDIIPIGCDPTILQSVGHGVSISSTSPSQPLCAPSSISSALSTSNTWSSDSTITSLDLHHDQHAQNQKKTAKIANTSRGVSSLPRKNDDGCSSSCHHPRHPRDRPHPRPRWSCGLFMKTRHSVVTAKGSLETVRNRSGKATDSKRSFFCLRK